MENNSILKDLIITDEDINWAETILPGIKFDECRRNVIKNLESIDIQACPGSGKTTVLVAKLAILAKKWPFQYRGICILSHTNVVREEIQDRIGQTEVGRKLLSYPHFIGTFHSFFDKFLGMPWIKSHGLPIKVIDSDFVLGRRWSQLSYSTKSYLQRKYMNETCCEAIKIPLEFNLKCKNSANTYKNVEQVVLDSYKMGYFTFNEMILFAEQAINSSKGIQFSLQNRFPILLIDEAQDTNEIQWDLIRKLFPERSNGYIRQGYGDINQAIYSSYESSDESVSFPRENSLNIQNSKRFDDSIALIANKLAVNSNNMTGDGKFSYKQKRHTIFLFDKETIEDVIPAYARLILECFSERDLIENERYGCHVIGMVHSIANQQEGEFTKRVSNYWKHYNPNYTNEKPEKLIDYFYIGENKYTKSYDVSVLAEWIAKGLIRYLVMTSSIKYSNSNHVLRTLLNEFPIENQKQVRQEINELLFADIHSLESWEVVVTKIITMLNSNFKINNINGEFMEWKENTWGDEDDIGQQIGPNQYLYIDDESGRTLKLEFGSIHSVKGRTHLATLVLETQWHEANIKSILPWLIGTPGRNGKRNIKRLKCHYVALTRAKGLICIALPKEYISENIKKSLIEIGWNIQEI